MSGQYGGYQQPSPTQAQGQFGGYGGHQTGGYQSHSPVPPHSPGYAPPPPTQQPYAAAQQHGYHQGYGGPPPPPPPAPSSGGYQSDRPPQSPTVSVHHGGLSGFTARPEYGSAGGQPSYRPHEHSSAQDAIPSEKPYFSGDVVQETKPAKTSVLSTFTTGLNSALHDYARNLFPATSTYNQQAAAQGINTTHADQGRVTGHRFDSFARTRTGNGAKWYVDGHDYMYAVSVALEKAQKSIYILDCRFCMRNTGKMLTYLQGG
jgi:hypothetical protein